METIEQRTGDTAYLAIILRAIEGERQLLGLDAEKGIHVNGSSELTLGQLIAQASQPRPTTDEVIAKLLEARTTAESNGASTTPPTEGGPFPTDVPPEAPG